jgi:hypothetical protein
MKQTNLGLRQMFCRTAFPGRGKWRELPHLLSVKEGTGAAADAL